MFKNKILIEEGVAYVVNLFGKKTKLVNIRKRLCGIERVNLIRECLVDDFLKSHSIVQNEFGFKIVKKSFLFKLDKTSILGQSVYLTEWDLKKDVKNYMIKKYIIEY